MYICPVCKNTLKLYGNSYKCKNNHCFDLSKNGYVNLLTTKGHNPKKSGDNPEMVKARSDFLSKDYYLPLANKICFAVSDNLENTENPVIIDSGSGEGYYTLKYAKNLPNAMFYGIDISKKGVSHGMSGKKAENINNCEFAVASSFELPFESSYADMVISTFAPVCDKEYSRVLKNSGKLIIVSPSPKHLFELKAILYDKPYENKPNNYGLTYFEKESEEIFEYKSVLENNEDIKNLFLMTPYCYKTSAESTKKLDMLKSLEITFGFCIQIYVKK